MSENENYDVGYGKPPKAGQFQKGQSGNPGGKKKGTLSIKAKLQAALEEPIEISEGGKAMETSKLEALFKRILHEGLKGDSKSSAQIIQLVKGFFQGEEIDMPEAQTLSEEDRAIIKEYLEFKKLGIAAAENEAEQ